jgi:hypothetical protein
MGLLELVLEGGQLVFEVVAGRALSDDDDDGDGDDEEPADRADEERGDRADGWSTTGRTDDEQ